MSTVVCRNTAEAARTVADLIAAGRRDVAAIASEACAGIYGLAEVEDLAAHGPLMNAGRNDTRFICIAKDLRIYPGATKVSLMLTLPHEPG